jgi:hypothetical protein
MIGGCDYPTLLLAAKACMNIAAPIVGATNFESPSHDVSPGSSRHHVAHGEKRFAGAFGPLATSWQSLGVIFLPHT